MTREQFIKKWLGNKDYQYTEQNRDLMRDDLDKVIKQALLLAVFSSDEMIDFGNFIRDNYYVAGSPKMLSYHPEKYPHGKVDDIFVYWCLENDR